MKRLPSTTYIIIQHQRNILILMCCCCNIFAVCFPIQNGLNYCCSFFRRHLLFNDETTVGFLREKHDLVFHHEPFLIQSNPIQSDVEVSSVAKMSTASENVEYPAKNNIFSMPNRLPIIPLDRVESIRTECVICLDEFSVGNPPMLTLCACGENRTSFHYHCLLLWLQRKTSCPNCGRRLYYQVCRSLHNNLFLINFQYLSGM